MILEIGEGETLGADDDEGEHGPGETETAGLAREATDDLGPSLDLAQRALQEVGAAQPFAESKRVVEMHAQRRQVLGQTCRRARVVVFELTDHGTQTSLAISGRSRLVERRPKDRATTIDEVLLLGQLGEHVAQPMHGAALTIAGRPQLG